MDIKINGSTKLVDIQHDFSKRFPYLKLEFYHHTHQEGETTGNADKIQLSKSIKEINAAADTFEWHINGLMTVKEVETNFQEKLNIGVHVFRKSGITWLQTGATDNWTLAEQNAHAREMLEELPKEEPEDYHEHE